MSRQSPLKQLLSKAQSEQASAIVLDVDGGGGISMERETAQVMHASTALSMMQNLARQALGESSRSDEIAKLTVKQAVTMHRIFETAATGALLASDVDQRIGFMSNLTGFIAGWGDATGLEGVYTSGLSLLGPDVGTEALMSATLVWDQHIKDGAFPNQFGALVAASDSATVSLLGPGRLQGLGLSGDVADALRQLDMGPSGWGSRLETFGYGPGSPAPGPIGSLDGGYPSGYFDEGFTPGILLGSEFIPSGAIGAEGPGGAVPAVSGMKGPNGFVPGALLPVDGGTGFFPGGVGSATIPAMYAGSGGREGGGCPVDESYLSESTGHVVHDLAATAKDIGKSLISSGLTIATGGLATVGVGAGIVATAPPPFKVIGVDIVGLGVGAMGVGVATSVMGASIALNASVVESVTKPAPPTTTSTSTTTMGPDGSTTTTTVTTTGNPHPKDEEEFDEYVEDALGLPASFKGLFPDVGCPDPFGSGLLSLADLAAGYETAWVPEVSAEAVEVVAVNTATDSPVTSVRPIDPGVWWAMERSEDEVIAVRTPTVRRTSEEGEQRAAMQRVVARLRRPVASATRQIDGLELEEDSGIWDPEHGRWIPMSEVL
ncbi:hypothetical protein [Micromonospora sp. NPDC007230]|uniref:hypothetical protein n=1 Tax=Micromonospora sp. NPDC007230 TaxID=3364237 RepID=UPI0036BBA6E8